MARPIKKRKVCSLPENRRFGPKNNCNKDIENIIDMSVDEYESIRLIDYEGLTQEEASRQMQIARTTVQGIYSEARKKISLALVEGRTLEIVGGNYKLCSGSRDGCKRVACRKRACRKDDFNESSNTSKE